jgi:3-hydroxyisobutyrate dehydrogenase-like beta-hydroxyacid dehydrogenase
MGAIGFVGLGTMGGRIARRLLQVGHVVDGYNRTAAKTESLVVYGLRPVGSPREAASGKSVVFSMVSDDAALRAVAEGEAGLLAGLEPGAVWVDMSTVSPRLSTALADACTLRGACRVEAPVSGSVASIEQGTLSVYLAGDREAVGRVEPLVGRFAGRTIYVGQIGRALSLKLAINLSIAVQMVAFGEGVLLAEREGIPRQEAIPWMLESAIASPMLRYRAPFLLEAPEEVWFTIRLIQKDVRLALGLAEELDLPLPLSALTADLLRAARAQGLGERELADVVEVLERLSGSRNRKEDDR